MTNLHVRTMMTQMVSAGMMCAAMTAAVHAESLSGFHRTSTPLVFSAPASARSHLIPANHFTAGALSPGVKLASGELSNPDGTPSQFAVRFAPDSGVSTSPGVYADLFTIENRQKTGKLNIRITPTSGDNVIGGGNLGALGWGHTEKKVNKLTYDVVSQGSQTVVPGVYIVAMDTAIYTE